MALSFEVVDQYTAPLSKGQETICREVLDSIGDSDAFVDVVYVHESDRGHIVSIQRRRPMPGSNSRVSLSTMKVATDNNLRWFQSSESSINFGLPF
jgi:hypothetical protein